MLNQYLEKEQESRAIGEVATLPERTYQADEVSSSVLSLSIEQPEPPAEQYSGGWFDGLIGEKPRYPGLKTYWSGYQQGLREYYATLAGIELPNDC